jgi:hypothetical protein
MVDTMCIQLTTRRLSFVTDERHRNAAAADCLHSRYFSILMVPSLERHRDKDICAGGTANAVANWGEEAAAGEEG